MPAAAWGHQSHSPESHGCPASHDEDDYSLESSAADAPVQELLAQLASASRPLQLRC